MYRANRIAWYFMTGVDPLHMDVEHRDRNRANNRWTNLRLATRAQNQANRTTSRGWQKFGEYYYAKIEHLGKIHGLGRYTTPEKAHEAYKAKHIEIHGTFSPYYS